VGAIVADLVWDPTDIDKDGVFWDPDIGRDDSPDATAARARAEAKRKAESPHAQKQAKAAQDEKKKTATKQKKASADNAAAMSATDFSLGSSSTSMTTYAIGGLAALAVLFLLTRR